MSPQLVSIRLVSTAGTLSGQVSSNSRLPVETVKRARICMSRFPACCSQERPPGLISQKGHRSFSKNLRARPRDSFKHLSAVPREAGCGASAGSRVPGLLS